MGKFNKTFNAKNPLKYGGTSGETMAYSSAYEKSPLGYSPFKQNEEEEQSITEREGGPGITGQDTGEIATDADGNKYTTSQYDTQGGVREGDKIIIPPKYYGNIMGDVNMLQDEDYKLTQVSEGVWTISGGVVQEGPTERERMEREQGTWQGE